MRNIEIARRFSELRQVEDACKAYTLALQLDDLTPEERMEAAVFLFQLGKDYRVPYTCFIELYHQGCFQTDILSILTDAFYKPNEKLLQNRYKRNVNLLRKYPYCFQKDFPAYHNLPIRFYPYEDGGKYIPFYVPENRFGEYVNIQNPVVTRNFFRDLEKPVLASDVFSQYELEYLTDNVRPSEYVARENHLYLHYSDWETFCSWLSVLNLRPILERKNAVFLIGDEISQYPIDFKERFGIDYSKYPVKPIGIREVTRLIWHTQLSSSNGGDFFNEVFDSHPNLLSSMSILFDSTIEAINCYEEAFKKASNIPEAQFVLQNWESPHLAEELYRMKRRTKKDWLVAVFLKSKDWNSNLCADARIVPALFFQPHFKNMDVKLFASNNGHTVMDSDIFDKIKESAIFTNFKYVKSFTPLRRFTTSFGSTVRFIEDQLHAIQSFHGVDPDGHSVKGAAVEDEFLGRILNRTYLRDPDEKLYCDSVIVRFEDGKLNPKATFTALAEFLDLPYTESMTYCSEKGIRDVETAPGNAVGFDTATVYKTYDEYCNDSEGILIEYFLRDAYEYYHYDFHYYDGSPMDEHRVEELIDQCNFLNAFKRKIWKDFLSNSFEKSEDSQSEEDVKAAHQRMLAFMESIRGSRLKNARILLRNLHFFNKRGQPLEMTPMLQPDPALLVQPLYH